MDCLVLFFVDLYEFFSCGTGCFFILLKESFAVQKLLGLMEFRSFFLIVFIIYLFVYLFIYCCYICFCSQIQKIIAKTYVRGTYYLSFLVSALNIKIHVIHFELMFVCGTRQWSSFTLLHVAAQFSQHHLLKRVSFPYCVFLAASS